MEDLNTPAPPDPADMAGSSLAGAGIDKAEHVGFAIADQTFAFGMEKVLEIIRYPSTVAVPMTPSAFVGLANLRGRVLPVLDFRTLVTLPPRPVDDATRIIVVDIGQVVGLVVDRVLRVMHVEAREVEAAGDIDSLVSGDLLDGVVKQAGGALVQLVEPGRVVGLKFTLNDIRQTTGGLGDIGGLGRAVEAGDKEDDTGSRLISVAVAGQEYGLAIEHVDEIVRLPEVIGTVPNVPGHVLGIINLRNRVLPLVCMRRMLNLAPRELTDSNRVVVVQLADTGGSLKRVCLVVDKVNEVIRVDPKVVSDVPALLSAHRDGNEITGICRLDGGRRLLSILSTERLFQRGDVTAAARTADAPPHDQGDEVMTTTADAEDCQAIIFQMMGQEFGLMVEHVREILRVPDDMNKVPRTADYVVGMMNLRGGVLPVMDMRSRLGLPRQDQTDRQRVIVVDLDGRRSGFIVDGVSEVLRMPASALIETPRLSNLQREILGKAAKLDGGRRLILIVDPLRLVDEKALNALTPASAAA